MSGSTFFSHALSLAALYGPGPWPDEGNPLPDEPEHGDGAVFAAGALDGILSHHLAGNRLEGAAGLADLLAEAARGELVPAIVPGLERRLEDVNVAEMSDELSGLLEQRDISDDRVRELARLLVEGGTLRESVKIGLLLLSLSGDERDRELLLLMGALEELTLFAVDALWRTQPDPHRAIFDLARRVRGWGRVQAVERLADSRDPEIKSWLLRDGFRNDVMDEYLALTAAVTGGLRDALSAAVVDDDLLDGAGAILTALVAEYGPGDGIEYYLDAVPVLWRYAELVDAREPCLRTIRPLVAVLSFLDNPIEGLPWRFDVDALRTRYAELLGRPEITQTVLAHLADPARADFLDALWPANVLGLRPRDQIVAYLEQSPVSFFAWSHLCKYVDPCDAPWLADLAERLLPPEQPPDTGIRRHLNADLAWRSVRDRLRELSSSSSAE
ncbi:hypothetical protein AB5J62_08495 [Amycolatopsis sp. cg5]|uniref:hypothetical protein n=1 Tax=Amycolatopsis sp. cg5 TaxID=3238802 RepID=UPI003524172B